MKVITAAVKAIFFVLIVSGCKYNITGSEGLGILAGDGVPPPNIVLIYADDFGWRDSSSYGSNYYETPNLDRLVSSGMMYTNAYSNAPNCAPSRASLLTGQYVPRHGIYTVGSSERGESKDRKLVPIPNRVELDSDTITMSERLQSAGYVTAIFGKWHLGDDPKIHGFDVSKAANRFGRVASYFCPFKDENREVPDLSESCSKGDYLTDEVSDLAVNFIHEMKEESDKPFFLYLSHYSVHTPIDGHPDFISRFNEKSGDGNQANPQYASMVYSLDQSVGRVMKALNDLGVSENTVVIFYSDNGGYGPATDMAPLKGSKGMLYEGGIRVPMVVRWPGVVAAGKKSDTPVIGTDLCPTFLEIAGITQYGGVNTDGVSLVQEWKGASVMEDRPIYWHFPAYLESYKGDKKSSGTWRITPSGAVRFGRFKLIERFETGQIELYDLVQDIGEKDNLADKFPEKSAMLLNLLKSWRRDVGAPVPMDLNPEYKPQSAFAI